MCLYIHYPYGYSLPLGLVSKRSAEVVSGVVRLILFTIFCVPALIAQTLYINGNNAAANEARKTFTRKPPKGCEKLQLSASPDAAVYIFDVALDANGVANGTVSKGTTLVWSDSYDSNFYHYSDRGRLNGKLLLQKFCYGVKAGSIQLN